MPEVSFTSAQSYHSTMEQLVGVVRARRGREEPLEIDVHTISGSFQVLLRCSDLWITGFVAGNGGTYFFSGHGPSGNGGGNELPIDGSHGELGTEGMILREGTFHVLADLVNYQGRCHTHVQKALSLVVIAIAEALRYDEIQAQIRSLLAREIPQIDRLGPLGMPNSQWTEMIKNWRTNSHDPEWRGFVRIKHLG